MSDLQANVTANLGQTLQQLDALKARIDAINRASQAASRSAKDHQSSMGGVAKAAGKAGGQYGSVFGRVGEASGMAGPLGPLAAGLVIAGAAFKTLSDVVNRSTEAMRRQVQVSVDLVRAASDAQAGAQKAALGAVLSQAGAKRRLLFRGGQEAVGTAASIAQAGVPLADAQAAVADSYDIPGLAPGERGNLLDAARRISQTGDMSMPEALRALAANPGARAAAQGGDITRAAALAMSKNSPSALARNTERLEAFRGQTADLDRLQGTISNTDALQGNDLNGARVAAGARQAEVVNPEAVATGKLLSTQLTSLAVQRQQLLQMTQMATFLSRLTGNSAALEYQAAVEAFNQAQLDYTGGGR
jgi:hypothetical protein